MDSQVTLTNNHERFSTRLVFSKNSVLNANLLVDGRVRYIISTTDRNAMKTKILDVETQRELVLIRKRAVLSDKIAFSNRQDGEEQKLSDVLRDRGKENGSPVYLLHTEEGDLYWKLHPVHRLALFSTYDTVNPVAYRESIAGPNAAFTLVIKREFDSISDYIIATFLVLEQRIRVGEKGTAFVWNGYWLGPLS